MAELRIVGVPGMPEIVAGDDLPALLVAAIRGSAIVIDDGDVVVVTQKVVSKAEGRLVRLGDVEPSASTVRWAAAADRDPRLVELALREAVRVIRMERRVLVTETLHGLVCANSGVDASNVPMGFATLLPVDPDASARRLRAALSAAFGRGLAVVVSDTFGRPWREGQTNVAIGVSGLRPLEDHRGTTDPFGHKLQATVIALADELASAAELVMGKTAGVPAAIIKGARYEGGDGSATELQRPRDQDLFR
jgi:coenzyme F420-0:L-glutamate ligase / coenzyme F420-1:gamma-L-glutamate ligase